MQEPHQASRSAPPRTAYSVAEVAQSLGLSGRQVYQMCDRGELSSFRVGRRVLIPAKALADFIESMTAATA